MQSYVVTGIGTNIGKTVCSAVLCQALKADYWKPIQSGELDALDSDFVKSLTSETSIIPANHLLTQPLSPHAAAQIDGIKLTEEDFELPHFKKTTLIEGAGGLMVPINTEGLCFVDLFQLWHLPVFVVTKHYLGSINHTLMTLNTLFQREIQIEALVVNGERNASTEEIYHSFFPDLKVTFIPEFQEFTKENIEKAAKEWLEQMN